MTVAGGCLRLLLSNRFLPDRTELARFMFAIGGNPEAARRAGIPLNRYRINSFMLGGFTAGISGLLYVSRLDGYSTSSTDPTLVLFAVAAVIGGTSLYGGRGKMTCRIIVGIMLAVIINGLVLIQISQPMHYVLIGVALLGAVVVDSLARQSQPS